MTGRLFTLILLILLTATGCASRSEAVFGAKQPDTAQVKNVPVIVQEDNQCAAAALLMAAQSQQVNIGHEVWKSTVFTPEREGALPSDMLTAPRRQAMQAFVLNAPAQLTQAIAEGYPVIVLMNLKFSWWPQWHYAVATGYDRTHDSITLHTGREKKETWQMSVFMRLWQRSGYWAMVMTPANRLPQFVTAQQAMESAIGLEKAQHLKAAYIAYHQVTQRFSDQCTAYVGMGNTAFRLEENTAAKRAWEQAKKFPACRQAANNNLAEIVE
ncbi:MAG: PA2778 family cysteine peptidase [Alphaproteobacteria bacterium]|nr:PA2778 family cysteine peptidase [Alphaproteobacteria bacterium]